jgi:hypothetical protein
LSLCWEGSNWVSVRFKIAKITTKIVQKCQNDKVYCQLLNSKSISLLVEVVRMNKKTVIPFILSIISILLIVNTSFVKGVDFSLVDVTNDIVHVVDGVTTETNLTSKPEIDIISLVMNESFVAVAFLGTPFLHIDNFYDFIVYWNGDQNVNFTDGHWNLGNIISQTKLVNSTGGIIVNTKINDSIEMIGNTIYYPIYNASLIVTDLDPINMIMDARQRGGPGADLYRDVLEYNSNTGSAPGFTFVLSILGLSTIILAVIIYKKKR